MGTKSMSGRRKRMPKEFEDCVKGGGRVRTISGPRKDMGLQDGEFMRVCFPKNGGGMVRGEKKQSVKKELKKGK